MTICDTPYYRKYNKCFLSGENRLILHSVDCYPHIRYNLLRAKYYIHNKLHIFRTIIMFFRTLYIIEQLAYKKGRKI